MEVVTGPIGSAKAHRIAPKGCLSQFFNSKLGNFPEYACARIQPLLELKTWLGFSRDN